MNLFRLIQLKINDRILTRIRATIESIISSQIKVKFDPTSSITNSIQSSVTTDLPDDVDDLTIEQLAQYVQRLKNKRERLDAEINKCKQLLIQKLE
jgi:hypothetical protein